MIQHTRWHLWTETQLREGMREVLIITTDDKRYSNVLKVIDGLAGELIKRPEIKQVVANIVRSEL